MASSRFAAGACLVGGRMCRRLWLCHSHINQIQTKRATLRADITCTERESKLLSCWSKGARPVERAMGGPKLIQSCSFLSTELLLTVCEHHNH